MPVCATCRALWSLERLNVTQIGGATRTTLHSANITLVSSLHHCARGDGVTRRRRRRCRCCWGVRAAMPLRQQTWTAVRQPTVAQTGSCTQRRHHTPLCRQTPVPATACLPMILSSEEQMNKSCHGSVPRPLVPWLPGRL